MEIHPLTSHQIVWHFLRGWMFPKTKSHEYFPVLHLIVEIERENNHMASDVVPANLYDQ